MPMQNNSESAAAARESSSRIFGAGEMAALTRVFDWSSTPVGPIDTWPDALITTVNLLLECRNPMFLWWGAEMTQFYNDAYRPSLGADKHPRALGQSGPQCWPEIWSIIGPQIAAVQRGESVYHRDALIPIYRDGVLTDVYWTYSYSPVRFGDGVITGVLVVCNDTTEEVVATRRLRESESRFRRLIEEASVGFLLGDMEGNLTYLNPRMQALLGYATDDVASGSVRWRDLTPPEYAEADARALQQLAATGRAEPYEKAYLTRDGRRIPLLVGAFVMQRAPDGPTEVAVFLVDLTVLRRAEDALRQSEKLAAVGRLASSIAHEINNPLEAVTNLLYIIASDPHSPEVPYFLSTAQSELQRVAAITTQTLRFHRQSRPRAVTITDLIEGILTIFQSRLMAASVAVVQRHRPAPPVFCYDGDVRQVLANLFSNALDATRSGGLLHLRSRPATDWRTGRSGLRITVADNGHGMSPEIRHRIFEPFFTTKEATGTGLGLWISEEILRKHGAFLSLHSRQGDVHHGTVFALWFPFDAIEPTTPSA